MITYYLRNEYVEDDMRARGIVALGHQWDSRDTNPWWYTEQK